MPEMAEKKDVHPVDNKEQGLWNKVRRKLTFKTQESLSQEQEKLIDKYFRRGVSITPKDERERDLPTLLPKKSEREE